MLTIACQRPRLKKWLLYLPKRKKDSFPNRVKLISSMEGHRVRYLMLLHYCLIGAGLYSLGYMPFLTVCNKYVLFDHGVAGLQGFSGMNRFNTGAWSKVQCEMILGFLSYAEYFRPRYFLLENVRNFVSFNKGQTFRLTLATLLEMGYQVAFNHHLVTLFAMLARFKIGNPTQAYVQNHRSASFDNSIE